MQKLLFALSTFVFSQINIANELTNPMYGAWGMGFSSLSANYAGNPTSNKAIPLIFGGYGALSIDGNRASYTFYKDGTYYASAIAQSRTHQARLSSDSPNFAFLGDKKTSFEAGLAIGRRLPHRFGTNIALLSDVSNTHQGQEIDWQLYRHDRFSNIRLLSAIAIQIQSKQLANYYFATNNYQPNSATVFELEFIATYPINDWRLFLGTRNYFYSNKINTSPLSNGKANSQVFLGVGKSFN